jgi:hypothetical protein
MWRLRCAVLCHHERLVQVNGSHVMMFAHCRVGLRGVAAQLPMIHNHHARINSL